MAIADGTARVGQVQWMYASLPDGRQPIWAVSDEEDEEFLAAWDEAVADAPGILSGLLKPLAPRPCPEEELRSACARLRRELADDDAPMGRLLRAAGGVDPAQILQDDHELWVTLAAGVMVCRDEPPEGVLDEATSVAWMGPDHPDWIGAVVSLARAGPGQPADADTLVGAIDDDEYLTPLGWWGLPEALLRAWGFSDDDPTGSTHLGVDGA